MEDKEEIGHGEYYSETFKHAVRVYGIAGGRVYYEHLTPPRAGENSWKDEGFFRACYERRES